MYFNQEQKTDISVVKLILLESEGYKDQWIRSLNVNASYEDMNALHNLIDRKVAMNTTLINSTEVSQTLPNVCSLSSTPVTKAEMPYGWGEKRGKFMLLLSSPSLLNNGEDLYFIQGYTNYWGVSSQGHIDETMLFFINSIVVMQKTITADGMAMTRVIDYLTILSDPTTQLPVPVREPLSYNQVGGYNQQQPELLIGRPEDITSTITQQNFIEEDFMNVTMTPAATYKSPTVEKIAPHVANRNISVPTKHVSEVLTKVLQSDRTSDMSFSPSVDVMDQATAYFKTPTLYDIPFIKEVIMRSGGKEVSSFTTAILKDIVTPIDPNAVMIIPLNRDVKPVSGINVEDSSELHGADIETRTAILAVEAIASFLSESLLLGATISITNVSNEYMVSITNPTSIVSGIDLGFVMQKLETRILNELCPILTHNNAILVFLDMDINLVNDSRLTVSINSNPPVPFVIPVFADNVMSSLITDKETFDSNTNSYKSLCDTIISPR